MVVKLNSSIIFVSNHVWLTPGTNVDQAKKLLQESGLPIQSASDLSDAAEKAVASLN